MGAVLRRSMNLAKNAFAASLRPGSHGETYIMPWASCRLVARIAGSESSPNGTTFCFSVMPNSRALLTALIASSPPFASATTSALDAWACSMKDEKSVVPSGWRTPSPRPCRRSFR